MTTPISTRLEVPPRSSKSQNHRTAKGIRNLNPSVEEVSDIEGSGCSKRPIEDFVSTLLKLINSAAAGNASARRSSAQPSASSASGAPSSTSGTTPASSFQESEPSWKPYTADFKGKARLGQAGPGRPFTANDCQYLRKELAVDALNEIHEHLWLFGTIDEKMQTVQPLHVYFHQMTLEIVVTEDPEKHLIRQGSRIHVKPLPAFLVSPDFWSFFEDTESSELPSLLTPSEIEELGKLAYGFLKSYSRLIRYHSDYMIARDLGLLPTQSNDFSFGDWLAILHDTAIRDLSVEKLNPRYQYGELRYSGTMWQKLRLNAILAKQKYPALEGWMWMLYLIWLLAAQEAALRLGAIWFETSIQQDVGWFEATENLVWRVVGFAVWAGICAVGILGPCVGLYLWGGIFDLWELVIWAVEKCNKALGVSMDEDFWVAS